MQRAVDVDMDGCALGEPQQGNIDVSKNGVLFLRVVREAFLDVSKNGVLFLRVVREALHAAWLRAGRDLGSLVTSGPIHHHHSR